MKKRISLLIIVMLFLVTGCMNNTSMENITIYTTSYPIEYVTNQLYGNHSIVKSIYPNGINIDDYEITDTLIDNYDDNDLYIFNGLTKERDYVKLMRNNNKSLKIIDVTSDISYDYAVEELWIDPSNLLSLANNIRKGFNEYIKDNPILIQEIEKNYKQLKVNLTELESKYRDELSEVDNNVIVVSDDMFLFLQNYNLKVISLDKDNEQYENNFSEALTYMYNGTVKNIFVPENKDIDKEIQNLNIKKIQLHTVSNLTDEQRENYNYISLITENLETIKKHLNNK